MAIASVLYVLFVLDFLQQLWILCIRNIQISILEGLIVSIMSFDVSKTKIIAIVVVIVTTSIIAKRSFNCIHMRSIQLEYFLLDNIPSFFNYFISLLIFFHSFDHIICKQMTQGFINFYKFSNELHALGLQ